MQGWYDLHSEVVKTSESKAAKELRLQAHERKETSERWDAMNKRRQQREEPSELQKFNKK